MDLTIEHAHYQGWPLASSPLFCSALLANGGSFASFMDPAATIGEPPLSKADLEKEEEGAH